MGSVGGGGGGAVARASIRVALVVVVRRRGVRLRHRALRHRLVPDVRLRALEHPGHVSRRIRPPRGADGVGGVRFDDEDLVGDPWWIAGAASTPLGGPGAAGCFDPADARVVLHRRLPQAATRAVGAAVPLVPRRTRRWVERVRAAGRHALRNRTSYRRRNRRRHPGPRDLGVVVVVRGRIPRGRHRAPVPRSRRDHPCSPPGAAGHQGRDRCGREAEPAPAVRRPWRCA
jgi:hypothetical protein